MQATLAAYDIAAHFPSLTVSCYTYGAPRTGNRAFADDYSRMVEDTWHIINGETSVHVHVGWSAWCRLRQPLDFSRYFLGAAQIRTLLRGAASLLSSSGLVTGCCCSKGTCWCALDGPTSDTCEQRY